MDDNNAKAGSSEPPGSRDILEKLYANNPSKIRKRELIKRYEEPRQGRRKIRDLRVNIHNKIYGKYLPTLGFYFTGNPHLSKPSNLQVLEERVA